MQAMLKTINGWTPPSPTKCTPTRITQVDSETDSVGNLQIKKILSVKMKFELEWKFLPVSTARRIMSELSDFNALVTYEDLVTGAQKSGRFYPGDFAPVPSVVVQNGEMLYETFALNVVEK